MLAGCIHIGAYSAAKFAIRGLTHVMCTHEYITVALDNLTLVSSERTKRAQHYSQLLRPRSHQHRDGYERIVPHQLQIPDQTP